jgi:hypothetical protein
MPPEYKRAGRIVMDDLAHLKRPGSGYRHGLIAAVLLVTSIGIGFGIPFGTVALLKRELASEAVMACVAGSAILWLWGCVHLTLHLNLNLRWSVCGLLWVLGLGILFWAGNRVPKWKHATVECQDRHD